MDPGQDGPDFLGGSIARIGPFSAVSRRELVPLPLYATAMSWTLSTIGLPPARPA